MNSPLSSTGLFQTLSAVCGKLERLPSQVRGAMAVLFTRAFPPFFLCFAFLRERGALVGDPKAGKDDRVTN